MSRKPSQYDLPPKKIALIAVVGIGGIALGTLFTLTVPDHRPNRQRGGAAGLGHATPLQQSVGRETNNMVWIPSGTYYMGSTNAAPDESPQHLVTLNGFWMDKYEVTNDDFERFVKSTGYITGAERKPKAEDRPHAKPNLLVPGANWRHPAGPDSNIEGKGKLPVVEVCWEDAVAFANWAGKRLPTEAEWEYAARGGLDRKPYTWGAEFDTSNKKANLWQGKFPNEDTGADGFKGAAPVGSFPPNGYGLHDMTGNVWEWCADWYRPDYYAQSPAINPPGPRDSLDPAEPTIPKKVIRGGSFLCNDVDGSGYRPGSRMKASPDTGLSDTGFRCVSTLPKPLPAEAK